MSSVGATFELRPWLEGFEVCGRDWRHVLRGQAVLVHGLAHLKPSLRTPRGCGG